MRVCRQKPKGAELKKYDNKVFRGILVQMNSLRRWPYTFIICVAFLTIINRSIRAYRCPLRDPEGFWVLPTFACLIALLLFAVGLVPAAIRRCVALDSTRDARNHKVRMDVKRVFISVPVSSLSICAMWDITT